MLSFIVCHECKYLRVETEHIVMAKMERQCRQPRKLQLIALVLQLRGETTSWSKNITKNKHWSHDPKHFRTIRKQSRARCYHLICTCVNSSSIKDAHCVPSPQRAVENYQRSTRWQRRPSQRSPEDASGGGMKDRMLKEKRMRRSWI